ncbi:uncharacterized protein LOC123562893 [Mercenaria mercenaria]|uniref:uncharacterized protein LOC123562893 n=1 Tax=Mercenaria mercenaria TaxID=6596 RepID=UPI00234EE75A|nr:uncharacterized protein LOC123562893 [Mercenaria mercenaria]
MSWYLEKVGHQIFVNVDDERKGEINNLKPGSLGKLEVILKSDEMIVLALADFECGSSSFSGNFSGVSTSRTEFLKKWSKLSENDVREQSVEAEMVPAKLSVNGLIETVLKDNFIGKYCNFFEKVCPVERNRRKLQQRMSQHLQMARLPEELFQKVIETNAKKQVSEKFFKSMLRIDNNDTYGECLDILLTEGQSAFKSKV